MSKGVEIHPSAVIDDGAVIGEGTRVWHFSHVMGTAAIGRACSIGQNVFIGAGVIIGDHVKIQNNVSIYEGVELADYVFCGPSCVFTNVLHPRSEVPRVRASYATTKVMRGASIGANATIVCGAVIGRYAFVGAGAVITASSIVPDYALMVGVPARRSGWMSRHGERLSDPDASGIMRCAASGWRYREVERDVVRCLDHEEDKPLP